jgi:hypothetical protein
MFARQVLYCLNHASSPNPFFKNLLLFVVEIGSCHKGQAGLRLTTLLPQPPEVLQVCNITTGLNVKVLP